MANPTVIEDARTQIPTGFGTPNSHSTPRSDAPSGDHRHATLCFVSKQQTPRRRSLRFERSRCGRRQGHAFASLTTHFLSLCAKTVQQEPTHAKRAHPESVSRMPMQIHANVHIHAPRTFRATDRAGRAIRRPDSKSQPVLDPSASLSRSRTSFRRRSHPVFFFFFLRVPWSHPPRRKLPYSYGDLDRIGWDRRGRRGFAGGPGAGTAPAGGCLCSSWCALCG